MATQVTDTTFSSTFKDDYRDSDNFHRILFNSGRALQARELTQMQTIIQEEIARFARNIFVEGAVVNSGGLTVNNRIEFIKLDTVSNPLPADTSTLIGVEYTVSAPNAAVKFKIVRVEAATGSDPATLYVRYTDTTAGTASADPIRVQNGAIFTASGKATLKAANASATGRGTLASVGEGSFFVQGHFVFATPQTHFVSKYTGNPSADIGFRVVEEVVTEEDDNGLYDNQGASPNIAAPGAHRYRIRLLLTTRDEVDSDQNFVLIGRINNGTISQVISGSDNYNEINKALAKRTREESGDYVVKAFKAKFDDLNDSNLTLDVSGGIAYVDGYRLDVAPTKITVAKARDTETIENETTVAQYGNYVLGNPDSTGGLPNINTFATVNLMDSISFTGDSIGTARVRGIDEDGEYLRFYLFDINMSSGQSFRNVRSFGNSTSDFVNTVVENGVTSLNQTSNNSLIFPLPRTRPTITGVSDLVFSARKRYTFTTGGADTTANVLPGTHAGSALLFERTQDWIITAEGTAVGDNSSITISLVGSPTPGTQARFENLSSATTYEVIANVGISTPVIRPKNLANISVTKSWPTDAESDGNGLRYIDLGVPDIFKVTSITQVDSSGASLADNFIIDNGQRKNFYGLGRLIEKAGTSIPTGDILIQHSHFTHDAGHLFAVNSYNNVVDYDDIPSFENVNLRDVLDFRPVINSSSEYTEANINLLPQTTDTIVADVVYYMPRKDQLILSSLDAEGNVGTGELRVITGISSTEPALPETPSGSIALYDIGLPPYTLSDSDVDLRFRSNKRFTMKDIAGLERRLNKLADVTSLSLLELNTSTLTVLDSNGLARTKSGFFADNFKDFVFSDVDNVSYRAALDPSAKVITPAIYYGNVRLFYDSASSGDIEQTTTKSGDLVTLDYTSTPFQFQNMCNESLNVNPFEVIINTGTLQLSPASDDWIEQAFLPDVLIDGGVKKRNIGTRTKTVRTFGGWWGIAAALVVGAATGGFGLAAAGATGLSTTAIATAAAGNYLTATGIAAASAATATAVNALIKDQPGVSIGANESVVRDDIIVEQIGDRVLEVFVIPYMRSKKVYFKAEGLKPNTEHFAFFNGVDVANWVREENFKRFSSTSEDFGNQYQRATEHPEGKTRLISDAQGKIEGSFFIPATSSIKFRTGSKILKLLDITADNEDNATSFCQNIFTSSGVLEIRERTFKVTREIDVETIIVKKKSILCFWDPLAQSFFVSQTENPSGIFVTSVDLFFRTKAGSGGQPVQAQIRGVENGTPLPYPIPGATKYLSPDDVNIPSDLNNLDTVRATPTTFTFDEPVYLAPGQEYAVVVAAETTDYNVYVAKTYDFALGSTEQRISKQPSLGSLFRSQNATTWTPDQERDLMFRINRAEFSTTGDAFLENAQPSLYLLQSNPFLTDSGSTTIRVFHEGHGFVVNDTVGIYGLDSGTSYAGIRGASILGDRTITKTDWSGYTFAADSAATSSIRVGGLGAQATQQFMFNEFFPNIQTLVPNNTSIAGNIKLTSGASWGTDRNNTTSPGGYSKDGSYSPIIINEVNGTTAPKLVANNKNQVANSTTLKLSLTTTDTKVSPILDLQRATMTFIENSIDHQDSSRTGITSNAAIDYVSETDPYNGSTASKHITTVATLAEEAVGLKVFFAAYRPAAGHFSLYYRTSTDVETITDEPWELVSNTTTVPSDESFVFREYEYLIGGEGGHLPAFTSFQLKIVMESTSTSFVPILKDLRAIALAV